MLHEQVHFSAWDSLYVFRTSAPEAHGIVVFVQCLFT